MQGVMERKKGTGGGADINGIIEEYKVAAGENISAGDFVSYINNLYLGADEKLLDNGRRIAAVLLTDTKMFIVHRRFNDYLYGTICTINGYTITAGTDTILDEGTTSGYNALSIVKLLDNKVFIAYNSDTTNNYLYGMLCTIEDNIITIATNTELSNNTASGIQLKMVALTSSRVFILHNSKNDNNLLSGMICNISGTTITTYDNQLSNSISSGTNQFSLEKLDTTRVFIISTVGYWAGMICYIYSSTITKGSTYRINGTEYASIITLSTNKVAIIYSSSSANYLYGIICTINGTEITVGTVQFLITFENSYSSKPLQAILLDKDKIFVAYKMYDNNYSLYGATFLIDSDVITLIEGPVQLSADSSSAESFAILKLTETKSFIAHSYNTNDLASLLIDITQIISLEDSIFGVSKQNGTSGDTIQIYSPDI